MVATWKLQGLVLWQTVSFKQCTIQDFFKSIDIHEMGEGLYEWEETQRFVWNHLIFPEWENRPWEAIWMERNAKNLWNHWECLNICDLTRNCYRMSQVISMRKEKLSVLVSPVNIVHACTSCIPFDCNEKWHTVSRGVADSENVLFQLLHKSSE